MKYERFEDLPLWNYAIDLAHDVYRLSADVFFTAPGDLRDHIRRAALSVSSNIASGVERGSPGDLMTALGAARGAAGELRSLLRFVDRNEEAAHLSPEIGALTRRAESCSEQIKVLTERLQHSESGHHHAPESASSTTSSTASSTTSSTASRKVFQSRQEAFQRQFEALTRARETQHKRGKE